MRKKIVWFKDEDRRKKKEENWIVLRINPGILCGMQKEGKLKTKQSIDQMVEIGKYQESRE